MDSMNIPQQNNNETVDITKQPVTNDNQQQNTIHQQQVNMNYQEQPMNTQNVDEHDANILAGISLACIVSSRTMIIIGNIINSLITNGENIITVLINIFEATAGIISLIGLVTMIITRIKYPKNKIGKAAMWTYIIITALELLAVIVATIACIAAGVAFIEACGNCPG